MQFINPLIIALLTKTANCYPVYAKIDGGAAITIDLEPAETKNIHDLKQMIFEQARLPSDQFDISYAGITLTDGELLTDAGIGSEAVLEVDTRLIPSLSRMSLYARINGGGPISFEPPTSASIQDLKQMISEHTGVPSNKFDISHAGRPLAAEQLLADAAISNEAVIDVDNRPDFIFLMRMEGSMAFDTDINRTIRFDLNQDLREQIVSLTGKSLGEFISVMVIIDDWSNRVTLTNTNGAFDPVTLAERHKFWIKKAQWEQDSGVVDCAQTLKLDLNEAQFAHTMKCVPHRKLQLWFNTDPSDIESMYRYQFPSDQYYLLLEYVEPRPIARRLTYSKYRKE